MADRKASLCRGGKDDVCIGKMCGLQCGHFIAAKFAGCKDSACSGRMFSQ